MPTGVAAAEVLTAAASWDSLKDLCFRAAGADEGRTLGGICLPAAMSSLTALTGLRVLGFDLSYADSAMYTLKMLPGLMSLTWQRAVNHLAAMNLTTLTRLTHLCLGYVLPAFRKASGGGYYADELVHGYR